MEKTARLKTHDLQFGKISKNKKLKRSATDDKMKKDDGRINEAEKYYYKDVYNTNENITDVPEKKEDNEEKSILNEPIIEMKKVSKNEEREEISTNPFVQNRFDPSYPVHNLCGPWSSGRQTSELEWSEPADKLLRILNSYNMFLAPGQLYGSTTNVSIAIYIESMSSFRAQTMDFEVDMYLAMGWYDRRLSHNCTHPILITHKFIAERIWTPDLYFLNSKFAYLQEVTTPNFMAIVYPDGLVFKSIRTDVTLSCMMDLQMFPMDEQECPLLIQSYAYVENIVTLNWLIDPPTYPIARNPNLKLNDMIITGTKYERCSGPYEMFRGTGNWSCIRGVIVMKRLVLFHLIQTYIPTGMLVSVSWMTFWLDASASPARISLTITSLLTLTTMSNGARQDLPQVSYVKAMDIWQTFSQALIFLVLLEYSFVSFYFTRRTFNCEHLRKQTPNLNENIKKIYKNHQIPHSHARSGIRRRTCNSSSVLISSREDLNSNKNKNIVMKSDETNRSNSNAKCCPTVKDPKKITKNGITSAGVKTPLKLRESFCELSLVDNEDDDEEETREIRENSDAVSKLIRPNVKEKHIHNLSDNNYNDEESLNYEMHVQPCRQCKWRDEQISRGIDYYSRFAFPAMFTIFTVAYWLYFTVYRPVIITSAS